MGPWGESSIRLPLACPDVRCSAPGRRTRDLYVWSRAHLEVVVIQMVFSGVALLTLVEFSLRVLQLLEKATHETSGGICMCVYICIYIYIYRMFSFYTERDIDIAIAIDMHICICIYIYVYICIYVYVYIIYV